MDSPVQIRQQSATSHLPSKRAPRVVIFKLNFFGDNVVFLSSVQELRVRRPDWQITVITVPGVAELYGGPKAPQRVLTTPKREFNKSHRRPWVLASWIWRVRRIRPDACLVSFDQGSAAHLVARLSGAPIRIGGYMARLRISNTSTEVVPIPEDGRPATWGWQMARALARSFGSDADWPDQAQPPDLRHLYSHVARPSGATRRVVVHSGASGYLNQWPPERFASVAQSLARDFDVIWVSHGATTGPAPDGIRSTKVGSLSEFAGLLANADLFLGNNSGPMHFANALGCPGVAVTGPSAMGWDPFWYRERWTVLRHPNLYCAPCEKLTQGITGCANTEAPLACLNHWTIEMVESACRSQLKEPILRDR